MNIFATFDCPINSARALDDKRVVKMILESAQMLSTATRFYCDKVPKGVYRSSHVNHPCNKWVRESKDNVLWLTDHSLELCTIYESVYHKIHKSEKVIRLCWILLYMNKEIPIIDRTPFAKCHPGFPDYRTYLEHKWENDKRPPTWKNRTDPRAVNWRL
jgi:hypothetical protein